MVDILPENRSISVCQMRTAAVSHIRVPESCVTTFVIGPSTYYVLRSALLH